MDNRQKELLKEIVESYIKNVKPVGSQALCKKFKLSSATIRNEMAALEKLGYIEKNHVSSGRVPSEKGYKYYVDNLMKPKELNGEDMLKLQTIVDNKSLVVNDIILKSMEIISELTHYTTVVLGKQSSENLVQKVEVIPIDMNNIVAIIVTDKGHVEHKNIKLQDVSLEEVKKTVDLIKLSILVNSNDGFKISEQDLKMRGPGDFFGSAQHGLPPLKIADIACNMELMNMAQNCARELLSADSTLSKPEHRALKMDVLRLFEKDITG